MGENRTFTIALVGRNFERTFKGDGSFLFVSNAELLKCGEQTGLEAPVVHTLNNKY